MISDKARVGLKTRLVNSIKNSPKKSKSVSELRKEFLDSFPELTINDIKSILNEVHTADKRLHEKGKIRKHNIFPNKGGNAFRYTGGGEVTKKGTGPYRDIVKVLDADSKKITSIFGAPHLNSYDVHAGATKYGKWTRPDILVELYRSVGSAKAFELHAIEYEGHGGFSPANVAQAFFSGMGANKCWLVFDSKDWPKNDRERAANPSAERIRDFAKKLGVGLIYYKTLHIGGTWHCLLDAKPQKVNSKLKAELKWLIENDKLV
jgi:hypothetical protein